MAFAILSQALIPKAVPPKAQPFNLEFKRQFLPFLLILTSKSSIFRVWYGNFYYI